MFDDVDDALRLIFDYRESIRTLLIRPHGLSRRLNDKFPATFRTLRDDYGMQILTDDQHGGTCDAQAPTR